MHFRVLLWVLCICHIKALFSFIIECLSLLDPHVETSPNSAHNYWKKVEGSCHTGRTPQENWDVHPSSPAAVETQYKKNDSQTKRLNSNNLLSPTDTGGIKCLTRKGDMILFYMNIQLDVIFAVILSLYEHSKNEIVTSYSSLIFLNYCGYAFSKHRNREEGYCSTSQFSFIFVPFFLRVSQCSWKWRFFFLLSTTQLTIESKFFNKWYKDMSSLLIYMVKYCFGFLLLEVYSLKVALKNLSQSSRLSPTWFWAELMYFILKVVFKKQYFNYSQFIHKFRAHCKNRFANTTRLTHEFLETHAGSDERSFVQRSVWINWACIKSKRAVMDFKGV